MINLNKLGFTLKEQLEILEIIKKHKDDIKELTEEDREGIKAIAKKHEKKQTQPTVRVLGEMLDPFMGFQDEFGKEL